jgi:hypothetical protein
MPAPGLVRSRAALALAWVTLALGAVASAQDGKLDRVSETVRDHDHGESEVDSWDDDDWSLESETVDDAIGSLIEWTVLVPFVLPRMVLHDAGGASDFAPFPYRDERGYWRTLDDPRGRQAWSARPRAELGTDFDDLERIGFGLDLEHASRFGLDTAWNRWREEVSSGATDELDLADLNLVYRFAHSEGAAFRAGLGLNYLNDEIDHELGFNSTYAATFLPARPLTLGFEGDLGTIGDATLVHLRAEAGFVLERFGLFASFDFFDIDDVELRSWGVGLRGWF